MDISSFLRLEIYNPQQSKSHAIVIDADDLDGSAWRRHLGINQAAIKMVDKLILRNDCKTPHEVLLSVQSSAGVIVEMAEQGRCQFCKSATLLPYCSGHGNETYSSLHKLKKNECLLRQSSAEDKPRPLYRACRLINDVHGLRRRMIVSVWRSQGGVRIEAYHSENSRKWWLEISDEELAMTISPNVTTDARSKVVMSVNPSELGVFALRQELENRMMETHGTKKQLQKRLLAQLAVELEQKKRDAEQKLGDIGCLAGYSEEYHQLLAFK